MAEQSLYDFLKREVQRMTVGIGQQDRGNIHPLIMDEVERCVVTTVLEQTNHNYVLTARLLGISRSRLYRRIAHLGISDTTCQR